jgi:hypothetical protein
MRTCYRAGMASPPVSLWTVDDRECVLCVVDGRRELHLRVQGRTVRLQTCADADAARNLADQWLREFPPGAETEG